jgi:hypothetical protein
MLEPTAWFRDMVAREGSDDGSRDPGHGIYVQSHPVAAVQPADCDLAQDETVGTSAQDLVEFLTTHPALEVTRSPDVEVGGFPTAVLDLAMAPDWTGTCPDMPGRRFAGLVTNGKPTAGFYDWGIADTGRSRYLIVDRGDGSPILIDISAEDEATFDALLPDVMSVIETFQFTAER